ncbi:hypothetical protein MLD38_014977 [Melastoma candidum]|uniref:Uncharacterized protein n=1 Tax=Melastoma candidum TaxID=119954 RepID=A0ACB9RN10_9MYRT|nr:hypothetical protein MLD38_014977 [Melastoma candidum]
MSAMIVCGKRSYFEELGGGTSSHSSSASSASASSSGVSSSSPPEKRIRCSPIRFSAPRQGLGALIEQLGLIFPGMDKELLEKKLEECGDDLDSANKSLYELHFGSANNQLNSASDRPDMALGTSDAHVQSHDDQSAPQNSPHLNAEWVELFVREMASATDMNDARARAVMALELLEKSILARAAGEASQQENIVLKQRLEALIQENSILKRAVAIQHERQKDYDDKSRELDHLRQLISQYQEQLRTLEVNNYTLTMHLKQALQGNSMPGRFNPDIF